MTRFLSIGLAATIVLLGYALFTPPSHAQTPVFPFAAGDTIDIQYGDYSRRCLIDEFFGAFVSCKTTDRPTFGRTVEPRRYVYNLATSISVALVKKGSER
jgi:hypothetical protein